MKLRNKIILTVVAAASYFFLTQLLPHPAPADTKPGLSVEQLQVFYAQYNEEFFNGKLPAVVDIDYSEKDEHNMGETNTRFFSDRFVIEFNPEYTKADRVALYVLLHEMCHIYRWDEAQNTSVGPHGPKWRTCMLRIDAQSGFRGLLIDNYREGVQ